MLRKLRQKIDKRLRRLQRLLQVMVFCRRLFPGGSRAYLQAVVRGYRLYRRGGFMPEESFRLGLLTDPARDSCRFISKKLWCRLQNRLNPVDWRFLVHDKGIFYRNCLAMKIPVPELFAIYFRNGAGWAAPARSLCGDQEWQLVLNRHLPAEFFIKPATGTYSRAIHLFRRDGEGFRDFFGQFFLAEDIVTWMQGEARYDSFVLQARLNNHPDLIRLSATDSLQTVRIITLLDDQGQCRILHAHFKPIIDASLTDTRLDGLEGNVEAAVDLETGRLIAANRISGSGAGIEEIAAHPATGKVFCGFPLPLWEDACRLVTSVAPKFLPMRSIGWDVALTPRGPVIVEGNSCWDPPNQHYCVPALARELDSCF